MLKKLLINMFLCFIMVFFLAAHVGAEEVKDSSNPNGENDYIEESDIQGNQQNVTEEVGDVTEDKKDENGNGQETLEGLKTNVINKKASYKNSDLRLMACIIYCEARGESYAGKKAVGIVVMNRVRSSLYPNTVKKVIYQKRQFQPTRNGAMKKALAKWDAGKFRSRTAKECIKAAEEALSGDTQVKAGGKTKDLSKYKFFSGRLKKAKTRIGRHLFR